VQFDLDYTFPYKDNRLPTDDMIFGTYILLWQQITVAMQDII